MPALRCAAAGICTRLWAFDWVGEDRDAFARGERSLVEFLVD